MSELDEILRLLTERVRGAVAAAVAGLDGLVVEQFPGDRQELTSVAAELSLIMGGACARLGAALEAGEANEFVLRFESRQVFVKMLGEGLYLILVTSEPADLAGARPLIERAAAGLSRALH